MGGPEADLVARLLDLQRSDGGWGVGVYDGDEWESTTDALWLLRELGADPSDARVRRAVGLVHERVRWEPRNGGRPFFDGETEACVNGRVLSLGAAFGHQSAALVDRLLAEQLDDGGWNCDAPRSVRSSFHSTICVLEGLLAAERATGPDETIAAARLRGEEFLLERRLLRRRTDGTLIDETWCTPHVPGYWCYDVLRGLGHLSASGRDPDPRIHEAVMVIRGLQRADGTWAAVPHPGRPLLELGPVGDRIATARSLRVLEWAGTGA
ncbi:MAG: hypothetical protein JWQ92_299 [Amnibacterium sp.]|nr:hypothetical protein [Amnibacterium sp.]